MIKSDGFILLTIFQGFSLQTTNSSLFKRTKRSSRKKLHGSYEMDLLQYKVKWLTASVV
jgi:hypothetical protein